LGNYEDKNRVGLEKVNSIDVKIDIITKSLPRQYYKNTLKKLAEQNFHNAETLCNYIIAEQNEINIKNSTKETKIKILVWLSNFHTGKNYENMTKEEMEVLQGDIDNYVFDLFGVDKLEREIIEEKSVFSF